MNKKAAVVKASSVGRQARLQASAKPYVAARPKRAQLPQAKASSSRTSAIAIPTPIKPYLPEDGARLYRDLCIQTSREIHPDIQPRSDFELCCLAEKHYKGSREEIYAQLDEEYATYIRLDGKEFIDEAIRKQLDTYQEPTGFKPSPGETSPYIHVRPIPGTRYSLRLFPGSLTNSEYCLDFVDNATGAPVNSPFEFELWVVPDWDNPLAGLPIVQKMRSIENAHNIKTKDILPGHEKFILRDGQTCVLARPGHTKIRFKVPIRRRPESEQVQEEHMIVFDLPKFID